MQLDPSKALRLPSSTKRPGSNFSSADTRGLRRFSRGGACTILRAFFKLTAQLLNTLYEILLRIPPGDQVIEALFSADLAALRSSMRSW
jgi:hypothetical protein